MAIHVCDQLVGCDRLPKCEFSHFRVGVSADIMQVGQKVSIELLRFLFEAAVIFFRFLEQLIDCHPVTTPVRPHPAIQVFDRVKVVVSQQNVPRGSSAADLTEIKRRTQPSATVGTPGHVDIIDRQSFTIREFRFHDIAELCRDAASGLIGHGQQHRIDAESSGVKWTGVGSGPQNIPTRSSNCQLAPPQPGQRMCWQ